ncbi:aminoglycoside adenylyltransferase domain-containing protein [Sporosarcina sp. YIM B06819]|uniref:aminoglycoside adenylyltransferase domain-containing protein n=1 Tax=Sporosarcina sp. YIM B06819 TaxID=3081769 RepID=UPI00298C5788|nr:aminoglycoside adenylyltransferase domain-containing protein [Sporosarcina sp. YIM B06819]
MGTVSSWKTCSTDIKDFVTHLLQKTKEILKDDFLGCYLHGSLAMGGFNAKSSDIDVLVITNKTMTVETKRKLAELFLNYSNMPYPVEISFVNMEHLKKWTHPCPFDFHYSEFWRARYQDDLLKGMYLHLNGELSYDADLAAHITIVNHRGISLEGPPIVEVFPLVPRSHYLASIMGDFQECLDNIEEDPVYCVLNLIRVYWYLKEGIISSKQEAGNWGLSSLPKEFNFTIQQVVNSYTGEKEIYDLEKSDLLALRIYINKNVQEIFHLMN